MVITFLSSLCYAKEGAFTYSTNSSSSANFISRELASKNAEFKYTFSGEKHTIVVAMAFRELVIDAINREQSRKEEGV